MAPVTQEYFASVLQAIREGKVTDTARGVEVMIGSLKAAGRIEIKGKEVRITFGETSPIFKVFGLFSDDRSPSESDVMINEGAERVIRAVLKKGKPPSNPSAAAATVLLENAAADDPMDFFNQPNEGIGDFFGGSVGGADGGGVGGLFDGGGGGGGDTEMEDFVKGLPKAAVFRGKITVDKLEKGTYQILPSQAIDVLKLLDIKYPEAMKIIMNACKEADTTMLQESLRQAAAEAVSVESLWVAGTFHETISAAQQGRRNEYNYYGVLNAVIKGAMAMKGKGATFTVIPAN